MIFVRPVCFLSDFGLNDDFVGTCKGVMAKVAPGIQVIDLTHAIPGFAVETGAEFLQHATRYMPDDAVYLAVVDPGVGTERYGIALESGTGAFLVGPDNGLLVPAAEVLGGVRQAVRLSASEFHVHPVSSTFHGRDVFSPVAAHLARGTEFEKLGERLDPKTLKRISVPEDHASGGEISARVIDVDRFGNARLSVRQKDSGLSYGDDLKLDAGDGYMDLDYVPTFGAAKSGALILLPDSHWRLSVAINKGNAARALALAVGSEVKIKHTQKGE
ncbi:SAM hydrolase/SAM-dependent halogenase family protein [Rubrobacter radiotolerans]|uniref:SAM-dependent chlorinase/fluorinase n=1 Tax=Rubrobacter radiotolerans TaxID=42256 RepID=A0AB35T159_RUBRA|nr:SAM-dependent chlorinase/fluorinase [Rubrobacter radiotolerans]MDX5893361.1 SAM-dependent chlorinase/fluorinase [Rubrobacter radiotolerans]